jgi:hypothetical protein
MTELRITDNNPSMVGPPPGEVPTLGFPELITRDDIRPHPIAAGETELIIQRHGKYERNEGPGVGSLPGSSRRDEQAAATAYFSGFLEQLPEYDRKTVDLLVVTSDTQYKGGGRRSQETARIAQDSASEVFSRATMAAGNIINLSHDLKGEGGPRPMKKLREPQMLNDSPDFRDFLIDKYGENGEMNLGFWIAFEDDAEKDLRLEMGAEGPDDIADRMLFSANTLARYSKLYHASHPDKRLIIWAATHYDTISPFVKREIFGVSKEAKLQVDYGAGIVIDIDREGGAKTTISGVKYPVPLKK